MPVREADIPANNRYLAGEQAAGKVTAFMCVRPEWDPEQVEAELVRDGFVGFKPYPDMVSGVKGADISIFDYLPEDQWAILDRNRRAVMLHLPRRGRLADDDNVRELLDIRQRYPNVTIIIAHFGRSFNPVYLTVGLDKLGGGEGFYFDTAAVLNPEVYDIAFDRIDHRSILYGSDMPIVLFHGRRTWTRDMYVNHSSEDFSWNTDREPPEVEQNYTLFLYEEVRAILEAAKRAGLSVKEKQDIFRGNALRALGQA
jgi:predicted TIM-barrel fold metal-dependent hydrolase